MPAREPRAPNAPRSVSRTRASSSRIEAAKHACRASFARAGLLTRSPDPAKTSGCPGKVPQRRVHGAGTLVLAGPIEGHARAYVWRQSGKGMIAPGANPPLRRASWRWALHCPTLQNLLCGPTKHSPPSLRTHATDTRLAAQWACSAQKGAVTDGLRRVISSVVERFVHIEDVGSSNLSSPTTFSQPASLNRTERGRGQHATQAQRAATPHAALRPPSGGLGALKPR